MKNIKNYIITLAVALFGLGLFVPAGTAAAYNPLDKVCTSGSTNEVCKNKDESLAPRFTIITNTLLFIVGSLSVIMIIVAGIMYTISGGDSGKVVKAKNMLTYAIVGLIVSFIAFAIVNWVIKTVK